MKNKFISVCLAFCLALSAVPVCGYAANVGGYDAEKAGVLAALGILPGVHADLEDNGGFMTKHAFYKAIGSMMAIDVLDNAGLALVMSNLKVPFNEKDLGDSVTNAEALNAVLRVLGYDGLAIISETMFYKVLAQLKLSGYIRGNYRDKLPVGDAVALLYYTIHEEVMTVSGIREDMLVYEKVKDITVLSRYHKVYKLDGVVTQNEYTSLTSAAGLHRNAVKIGDVVYDAGSTNAADYLGYTVTFYYQEREAEGDKQILHIAPKGSSNSVIEVDAKDIVSVSSDIRSASYNVGGKTRTIKISPAVRVVYNGQLDDTYTAADFMPSIGSVVFLSRSGGGSYDMVFINNCELVVADAVSKESKIVHNKYTVPVSVSLDDKDRKVSVRIDGVAAQMADLREYDVLLVKRSKQTVDGYTGVEAVRKTLSGVVEEINGITTKDDKGKLVTVYADSVTVAVDGTEYTLSKGYVNALARKDANAKKLETGVMYDFYCTANGEIAFAGSGTKSNNYVVAVGMEQKSGFDKTVEMKILTQENEWKIVKLAKKLNYGNGSIPSMMTAEKVYENLGGTTFKPQILRVKMNGKGELTSVEAAVKTDAVNSDIFTYREIASKPYSAAVQSLNGALYLDGNTRFVRMPVDVNSVKEEDYVFTGNFFSNDKWTAPTAYDMDEFNIASLVTLKGSAGVDNDYWIVKKLAKTMIDGEALTKAYCVKAWGDAYQESVCLGADEVFTVFETVIDEATGNPIKDGLGKDIYFPFDVKVGDVIAVAIDNAGRVTKIERRYSPEDYKNEKHDEANIYDGDTNIKGYVQKVSAAKAMMLLDCGSVLSTLPKSLRFIGTTKVFAYYKGNKKLETLTFADIEPGDYAWVHMSWTRTYTVYLIRD